VGDWLWTAEELERLTPAEQDAAFEASLVPDVAEVAPEFLARVRRRVQERIARDESRSQ
jgi:hypothetical protein